MIYLKKAAYFIASEETPLPNVSFVPMLTRRRLSMLSKMVVSVCHQIAEDLKNCKVTFASQFGEVSQQLKITSALVDAGTVSPAHFSSSVFNASIANASILEKITAGYSAVFAGKNSFENGLKDCIAALKIEENETRLFVFADEKIPECYSSVLKSKYPNTSCALALLLSKSGENEFDETLNNSFETAAEQALDFIKTRLM